MKVPELKMFAYLAFIMPVFFSIMWIMSATIDGHWTFGVNSLSDMGISENSVSAFLFNFACIFTGLFGAVIGLGSVFYGRKTIKAGGILYVISMLFLSMVGVFTLHSPLHFYVASSYGVFFALSVVVSSISDWKLSWYFYFDLVFIIGGLIVVFTQVFALWEAVMVIAAMVWTLVIGYKMIIREETLYSEEPSVKL